LEDFVVILILEVTYSDGWFLKFCQFFRYLKTEKDCLLSYIAFAWRAYGKR
jgi:hypothetical protein